MLKPVLIGALAIAGAALLSGCGQTRHGGELHLKHVVTVTTLDGEQTFSSVMRLDAFQTYNTNFGSSGWGGIRGRLTGSAVRVNVGDRAFYFLVSDPGGPNPARYQMDLIKSYFGFPNYTKDDQWVDLWKTLAQTKKTVELKPQDYPAIAVMPRDGWMDEARFVPRQDAASEGLHVVRYSLELTAEPVGANPSFELRYREPDGGGPRIHVGKTYFVATDAKA